MICCVYGINVWGQNTPKLLNTIPVTAPSIGQFTVGLRVQVLDSSLSKQYQYKQIDELLAMSSTLAIKNYGQSRLSTSSFRGTSAIHTAVLWNGLNINNPTLGQADLSIIPSIGFDALSIQYGASGSQFGSGAVGGSIQLENKANWNTKSVLQLGLETSSFMNSQIQGSFSDSKTTKNGITWAIKLASIYQNQVNNYPTNSRNQVDLAQSQAKQKGISVDLYLKNTKNSLLGIYTWLGNYDLVIEPNYTAARQFNQNLRLLLDYQKNNTVLKTAILRDRLDYYASNDPKTNPSASVTNRYILRLEHEFNFTKNHQQSLKIGFDESLWQTQVSVYSEKNILENRIDFYALFKQEFLGGLSYSINARQNLVGSRWSAFSPSLGIEYKAIQKERKSLKILGNVSRSYRVPTLNEKYWPVLGNPNLQPEKGIATEASVIYTIGNKKGQNFELGTTLHRQVIENWVYWNPDKNYRAENLQLVKVLGLEVFSKYYYKINEYSFNIFAQYSYTKSTQEKNYTNTVTNTLGKQVIYIPLHQAVINSQFSYKQWAMGLQCQYMGYRYIDFDNRQFLPAYVMINGQASKQMNFRNVKSKAMLSAQNIGNSFYLNVERKAMPGIQFNLAWQLII